MSDNEPLKRIALFSSGLGPCPYFEDRPARFAHIDPHYPLTGPIYDELLQQGFRRGGEHVYRPACPGCQACESLRLPVAEFTARRRHRRCLQRNSDLQWSSAGLSFRQDHYALYKRYVEARHPTGGMADAEPDEYWRFFTAEWCPTEFFEMRLNNQLIGVAIVDDTGISLSAVYTFFDPGLSSRSLGTFAILKQVETAVQRGYEWLYLGYNIAGCAQMDYKTGFCPHERLTAQGWVRVESGG